MKRALLTVALLLSVLGLLSPSAGAAKEARRANLWIYPPLGENGALLDELLDHPESWAKTRAIVKGLGFADLGLNRGLSDQQLQKLFAFMKQNGLALQLQVGAVKPWGETGQKTFAIDRMVWDRFVKNGAEIESMMMDEPLVAAISALKKDEAYAAEETAAFVALVRKSYPNVRVGDIEPHPSFSAEQLLKFVDDLQAKLRERGAPGLDLVRLDVDWEHFVQRTQQGRFGWRGVAGLEDAFHKRDLAFSLIYWAADYGVMSRANRLTPTTWDEAVTQEARAYAAAGGKPDEIVVQTWIPIPTANAPETAPDAFTKSVLDVYQIVCSHGSGAKACP